MEQENQKDCGVCGGMEVVLGGVCRNCGDGKPAEQVAPKVEVEASSNASEKSKAE